MCSREKSQRGRPWRIRNATRRLSFNSRPREGGDSNLPVPLRSVHSFNPRPREGGNSCISIFAEQRASFNPRPREGGDVEMVGLPPPGLVSIHAPAKGATR